MDTLEILLQLLNYSSFVIPLVFFILVIKYWTKAREFLRDLKRLLCAISDHKYTSETLNPAINKGVLTASKEPVLGVYGDVLLLVFRICKCDKVEVILEKGRAIARIPSRSMDDAVKALSLYLGEDISQSSVIRDYKMLQKALEVFFIESIVEKSGLDGALKIAMTRFANNMKEDQTISTLYNVVVNANDKLSQSGIRLDKRLLRILLIELGKGELGENWKMLM